MKILDICSEAIKVESGLMHGSIDFECNDRLMFAMKIHPAEELDAIIEPVYMTAIRGKEVPRDTIEQFYADLKEFKEEYKVKELSEPIEHLEEYLGKKKTAKTVNINYFVVYGKGDASDDIEWGSVQLSEEEGKLWNEAIENDEDPNDIPELQHHLEAAYKEIEQAELEMLREREDEYTLECEKEGDSPFDQGWTLRVYFAEEE